MKTELQNLLVATSRLRLRIQERAPTLTGFSDWELSTKAMREAEAALTRATAPAPTSHEEWRKESYAKWLRARKKPHVPEDTKSTGVTLPAPASGWMGNTEWPDVIGAGSTVPSEMPEMRLSFKEDAQMNDSIFWINPWSGQEEKVASFFWPTHPPEKTEEVERLWEGMGHLFANAFETRNQLNVALDSLRRNTAWSDADYKALKSEVQSLKDRDAYRENMIDDLKRDRDQWRTSANYLNQQADKFKADVAKLEAEVAECKRMWAHWQTEAAKFMGEASRAQNAAEINKNAFEEAMRQKAALEAENARLREALQSMLVHPRHGGEMCDNDGRGCPCVDTARQALAASPAPSAWRTMDSATEQCPHCLCPDKNQCGCEINA